jgi:hypothetical protein
MLCECKKKSIPIIVIISLINLPAHAQQYRLGAFGGYSLAETFTGSSPEDKLNSASHYGGILEFRINHRYSLELLYQRQNTSVDLDGKPLVSKLAVSWYLAGGVNYWQLGKTRWNGLAGLYLGAGNMNNQDSNRHVTQFAAGVKGGVLYSFSPSWGFRVQAQVLTLWGTPSKVWETEGMVTNADSYNMLIQLGFTGGLVYSFGHKPIQ